MVVIDAHCDAPSQMHRLRDFTQDNKRGQVDFPKLRRGGVDASFFALYIPASKGVGDTAFAHARSLLDALNAQVPCDSACFARSAADVLAAKDRSQTAVIIALENASALGDDLSRIEWFARRGVKYITLTHSADNQVCDSCTGEGTWSHRQNTSGRGGLGASGNGGLIPSGREGLGASGSQGFIPSGRGGLSPFGREVVREMNRQGVLVDLAHCSYATIRDVLELSDKPVLDTHTACRALCDHPRNLPDSLMADIAATGGVVGMSIYPCFISDEFSAVLEASGLERRMGVEDAFIADPGNPEKADAWWNLVDELAALPRPSVSRVVDHIEHAAEVCGPDHVAIGTDYDGIAVTPRGLETVATFGALWAEMSHRGFTPSDISAIAGSNLLHLL